MKKRSCESDLTSANGSVRRIRFGCSQRGSGFDVCESSLLSNHPKRPALFIFCAERITVDAREKGERSL
jgi:hypothetical protein